MTHKVIDVETTSINDNPSAYNLNNRLLFVGIYDGKEKKIWKIEYDSEPYGEKLKEIQQEIDEASLLVGFAFKFDLHWLDRAGIQFRHKPIVCLQSAEYILSGQALKMPPLDECLQRRGLPTKLPFDFTVGHSEQEWRHYLAQDLEVEWLLFQDILKQTADQPKTKRLIFDDGQDILITQEMEKNGIKYDIQKSKNIAERILGEMGEIDSRLFSLVPFPWINWASGDHLSAILFGGIAKYSERESYSRTLKSGEIKTREHTVVKQHTFPRLCEPGEKVKKEGYFKVDEATLSKLKATGIAKEIVNLVLARAKLEKKVGTYYLGIPQKCEENNWEDGVLHGQLHHTVTRTSRLSSSDPNLQNIEDGVRECIITRW